MILKVKKLTPDAKLPQQANDGDMYDIFSNEDITLNSFESKIVHVGIALDIPKGYRVKLFSRSSLPLKKRIIVSNCVGIIDTNYKNEIGVICHTLPNRLIEPSVSLNSEIISNSDKLVNNMVEIKKGDKIAQIQLEKIEPFTIQEVDELDLSNDRGGGFGSTGN